jgi:hypothetical protein
MPKSTLTPIKLGENFDLVTIPYRIACGDIPQERELRRIARAQRGEALPAGLVALLRQCHPQPRRGRPPLTDSQRIAFDILRYDFYRYRSWLKKRQRKTGLNGWSYIRNAEWWQGSIGVRALLMAQARAQRQMHEFTMVTPRHLRNLL